MRKVINLEHLEGLPAFSPPNHSGTLNHHLAHPDNGARNLAVWHGEIEPGGAAHEHSHESMDQAFYVLAGSCSFLLEGDEHRLGPGDFVMVPPRVSHRILSLGPANLRLLVIMAPPPASQP